MTGNPHGLETVYHAVAKPSSDSKSVITGADVSMGLLEDFEVERSLSLFSNMRDKLLGIREGPTVGDRSSVEEALCWAKLEND